MNEIGGKVGGAVVGEIVDTDKVGAMVASSKSGVVGGLSPLPAVNDAAERTL